MSPSFADSAPDANFAFNMDAASATISRINKFDGTNFHIWKFKDGAEGAVPLGSDKRGDQAGNLTTTLEQSTFERKSRKALAITCLAMENTQLPMVCSAIRAYDAWS